MSSSEATTSSSGPREGGSDYSEEAATTEVSVSLRSVGSGDSNDAPQNVTERFEEDNDGDRGILLSTSPSPDHSKYIVDELDKVSVAVQIASKYPCRYKERTFHGFIKKYHLPEGYRMRFPLPDDRVCLPRGSEIGVYIKNFALGLRFPIHPDIVNILCFIGLPIAQMPPNSLGLVISFVCLCRLAEVTPSVSLFRYFFTRHDHPEGGWIGVGARSRRKLLKTNTSNKDWKDGFVFITTPEGFPLPRRWTVMNREVTSFPRLSDEEWSDADKLLSISEAYRSVEILTAEKQLRDAGLSIGEHRV